MRMQFYYCLFILLTHTFSTSAQEVNEDSLFQQEQVDLTPTKSKDELLASQYKEQGAYEKASLIYEDLYDKDPSPYLYKPLLECYIELKTFKKAEKLIKRARNKFDKTISYKVDEGYIKELQGEKDQAYQIYQKLVDEFTSSQYATLDLANAFLIRKRTDFAIKTYEKGILNGQNLNLYLAQLYLQDLQYKKAIDYTIKTIEQSFPPSLEEAKLTFTLVLDKAPDEEAYLTEQLTLRTQTETTNSLVFLELLVWLNLQKSNWNAAFIQTKAIDRRVDDGGKRILDLGQLALSNSEFETAQKCFQYLLQKNQMNTNRMLASTLLGEVHYQKFISKGSYTPQEVESVIQQLDTIITSSTLRGEALASIVIKQAHLMAFYLHQPLKARQVLESAIASGYNERSKALFKMELADCMLLLDESWDAILLLGQVENAFKTDTLGQEAKYRLSKIAYYKGEFEMAKSQLDILKTATTKLIANNALELSLRISDNLNYDTTGTELQLFAKGDLFLYQNQVDSAFYYFDRIPKMNPKSTLMDDISYYKALAFIQKKEYRQAEAYLKDIIQNYKTEVLADNALFILAQLYDYQLNQKAEAQILYQNILTHYSSSLFVTEARKRFRFLRGDSSN